MTVSQILMLAVALVLFVFFCVVMYAVWQGLMEDTARLAIKVRKHTKR